MIFELYPDGKFEHNIGCDNFDVSKIENERYFCLLKGRIKSKENESLLSVETVLEIFLANHKSVCSSNGAFLLLVYDKHDRILTVIRDLIGIQHVYYFSKQGHTIISNTTREILELIQGEDAEIGQDGLSLYLSFQYIPQPFTIFKHIHQVPSGGVLLFKESRQQAESGWKEFIVESNNESNSPDIKGILVASQKRQIESREHIGALLSGGMDTSVNVALLVEEQKIHPITFTARFNEREHDETRYAKLVANHFGVEHIVQTVTSEIVFELSNIVLLYDNPIGDRAILPEYILCKLAQSMSIGSMLTGEGGDEILGFPRNLDSEKDIPKTSNLDIAKFYLDKTCLFQDWEIQKMSGIHPCGIEYLQELYETFNNHSSFEKIYFSQWYTWLIDNVLVKDQSLFKKFGLQFIGPFYDIDLMRHMKLKNLVEKTSTLRHKNGLKREMIGFLPLRTLNKQKHKFTVPIDEWIRCKVYDFVYEELLSVNSYVSVVVGKKALRNMLISHKQGSTDNNRKIWSLLFLEFWKRSLPENHH